MYTLPSAVFSRTVYLYTDVLELAGTSAEYTVRGFLKYYGIENSNTDTITYFSPCDLPGLAIVENVPNLIFPTYNYDSSLITYDVNARNTVTMTPSSCPLTYECVT